MGKKSVGSTLDRSTRGVSMLDEAWIRVREEPEYVEFRAAGTPAHGTFRCSACGYGVTINAELPRCPMCGGKTWEPEDS
jgi:rubrerythrin